MFFYLTKVCLSFSLASWTIAGSRTESLTLIFAVFHVVFSSHSRCYDVEKMRIRGSAAFWRLWLAQKDGVSHLRVIGASCNAKVPWLS